ncbi:MAG: hypothetical protein ACFFCW_49015 [Candidatus Hodarchaeota archaeon]
MEQKIDVNAVVDWLNQRWEGAKLCPICRNNNWNISQNPVELREFHGGGLVLGGPIYPLISITCKNCGHTLLFNAITAGLLTPEPKDIHSPAKVNQTESDVKKEGD